MKNLLKSNNTKLVIIDEEYYERIAYFLVNNEHLEING